MKRSAILAGAAATLAAPTAIRAQAKPLLPIKVGVSSIESYGEALYAQMEDFYKANGLDATPVTLAGAGAAMTLAVVSGELDVAVANAGSMAAAHLHNLGLYFIAPCGLWSSKTSTTVLAVAAGSPIRTAKDFEGKTIGVSSLGDLVQASTMNWIDTNGGNSKAVSFVEVSTNQQQVALTSNRIAGAVVIEPTLSYIKKDIRVLASPYDSVAKSVLISGWIANRAWFDANHETANRLLATIRQTAQWANHNHAATAAILAERNKIPIETLTNMQRVTYGETRSFAVIQPVIDVMAKYGMLAKSFKAADLFPPSLSREGRF